MNRINVIDLDGTLLPYDSVSRWIRHFKRLEGWFSPLRRWSLLYRFGWMDRSTFIQNALITYGNATTIPTSIGSLPGNSFKTFPKQRFNRLNNIRTR